MFPQLYHLQSLKNHFVVDFLVWSGSFCSFSFGFRCSLSNRKATDVATLLSLLEDHPFGLGRRDVRFWRPNPLEGFSCKSFFHFLVNPSPPR